MKDLGEIKVLISEEKIHQRIQEIAKQIEKDYAGKELVLLCILKGSTFFTVDLARNIKKDLTLEFIQVSSYGAQTISSGKIDLKLDIEGTLENKHILIVEDIIDTGRTLSYLMEHLKEKNPASIHLCTLLDKPERRKYDVEVDYVGFEIPDRFVVGYGLDYNELYRNLPYVGYFEEEPSQR